MKITKIIDLALRLEYYHVVDTWRVFTRYTDKNITSATQFSGVGGLKIHYQTLENIFHCLISTH